MDVDCIQTAQNQAVGFGQVQTFRPGNFRCQSVHRGFQSIGPGTGAFVSAIAGRDQAQLVRRHIHRRTVGVADAARHQTHTATCAQRTQSQRLGRHITDVTVARRSDRFPGHRNGVCLHIDGARARGGQITRGRLGQRTRSQQAEMTAAGIQLRIQRQRTGNMQPNVTTTLGHHGCTAV